MASDKVVMSLAAFSAGVALMSLYGLVWPLRIRAFARRFMDAPGIWIASAIRFLLAFLLWFSSPACRTTMLFRFLALLVLVATIAIPAMGTTRLQQLADRAETWPAVIVRLQAVVGIGFAAFVLWSIWPALPIT